MRIDEGFSIIITLGGIVAPLFWEVEVTPPGEDGGDPIDTSHQRSVVYVTKAPQTLVEVDDMTVAVTLDPAAVPQVRAKINVPSTCILTWPDTYEIEYEGFVRSFRPNGAFSRGNRPLYNLVWVTSNIDSTDGSVKGPVETPVAP